MNVYEDIALELARIERQALAAIRAKMAAQQFGEAWVDLVHPHVESRAGDVVTRSATG